MILQKLKRVHGDVLSLAECYYSLLSNVNNLHLTDREISLIAFTAINSSISIPQVRKDFCEMHNTTSATINNMISKLKKMYLFTKIDNKIVVNPLIQLNFEKGIKLEIILLHNGDNKSL